MQNNLLTKYDIIIIGGGATGLGTAVEAASRGYKTILFEAYDFGSGTSSKSTKLIHGGIRYLANLDIPLVKEGLSERFLFLANAPHLSHPQRYVIPAYSWFEKIKYYIGVKIYDFLAKNKKIGLSGSLNYKEMVDILPELKTSRLKGGVFYYDGQFDDTRMLITLLKTFESFGGLAYNYHEVIEFIQNEKAKITGIIVKNKLTNEQFNIKGKVVINAAGIFCDKIINLDKSLNLQDSPKHVLASQGTHLVFDKEIFTSHVALVIPKTIDNRVLFVLPWHDKVIVGTTDIPVSSPSLDPVAQEDEIDFILKTLNQYTRKKVSKSDIRSIFSGQRPLVKESNQVDSSKISRKHKIIYNKNNLITIVGGKWTIYRLMGEDTINFAIKENLIHYTKSETSKLHLYGYTKKQMTYPLSVYGSESNKIIAIQNELNNFEKLHPLLPYYSAEIIYHVRHEMAHTIEDILMRRTRAIFLNAKAAIESAPKVAKLMAIELKKDQNWLERELINFYPIAKKYTLEH